MTGHPEPLALRMTPAPAATLRLVVPCSTSNLGPGFDCLGCALQLYNEFDIAILPEAHAQNALSFSGPESAGLRPSPNNLFFFAAKRLYDRLGLKKPAMSVEARVNVPNARGLGSSATAIVAALLAANRLTGETLQRQDLVAIATEIEGHPDNVTPALLGGLTASLKGANGRVISSRWLPHESVAFILLSPDYEVATKSARSALPAHVPHDDAVANLARVPLLIDALVNARFDDLALLMEDRLHEPFRLSLYPNFTELKQAGLRVGVSAVTLSGAGPTMLGIAPRESAESLADAWCRALHDMGMTGRARVLAVEPHGARILEQ